MKTNCSIGDKYKKNGDEVFQWKKLRKIFYLGSGVEWIKSIKEIIDLRKLIIYLIIGLSIWGYAYYHGQRGKPIKVDVGYGKETYIKLNGEFLHIDKKGKVFVEDSEGNVLKTISVKDIPELKRKLKPYGLQLKPIFVAGLGLGEGTGAEGEAGAGISFFRYWKGRVEAFVTNRGAYLGTSYKLDGLSLENSSIGIGVGKGWRKGENRAIVYWRVKF